MRFVSDDFFSCFVHERLRFPLLRVPKSSGHQNLLGTKIFWAAVFTAYRTEYGFCGGRHFHYISALLDASDEEELAQGLRLYHTEKNERGSRRFKDGDSVCR